MTLALASLDLLWRNALGAIPLAIVVALVCRFLPCRPSTRHALWVIVLLSLLAPPLIPQRTMHAALGKLTTVFSLQTRDSHPNALDIRTDVRPRVTTPSPVASTIPSAIRQTDVAFHSPTADDRSSASSPVTTAGFATSQPTPSQHRDPSTRADDLRLSVTRDSAESGVQARIPLTPSETEDDSTLAVATCEPIWPTSPVEDFADDAESIAALQLESSLNDWMFSAGAVPLTDHTSIASQSIPRTTAPPVAVQSPTIARQDSSPAISDVESLPANAAATPWRDWLAGVFALREAVAQLSRIPTGVWITGAWFITMVLAVRTIRFRRVIRRAIPAPRDVERLVAEASGTIGLRTAPTTMMSTDRISPMIWCGLSRVLLLPTQLWMDLDSAGRRAVLLHELAHLRRRDHWVRWVELLVSCVYWWHPLVWIIRRRLRDEADMCCDAWVTSLMPSGRTGYARALLATRQYVSVSHDAVPAVGLAISPNPAKRFARRLTMVMTQQAAPKLSALGGAMTVCVAALAWIATPLLACPPESEKLMLEKELAGKNKVRVRMLAPAAETPAPTMPPNLAPEDATTFERHMLERAIEAERGALQERIRVSPEIMQLRESLGPDDGRVDEWLQRLEERLDQLTEQLEEMAQSRQGFFAPSAPATPRAATRWRGASAPATPAPPAAPAPMSAPSIAAPPSPPAPPAPPSLYEARAGQIYRTAPSATSGVIAMRTPTPGAASAFGSVAAIAADSGPTITRIYHLPEGKRDCLYSLMAREDVPVWVSLVDEGISVQGTPRQHESFQSFVILIHPEAADKYKVRSSGLGAEHTLEGHAISQQAMERALAAHAKAQQGATRARIAMRPAQIEQMRRALTTQQGDVQRQIHELHRKAEELSRKARELETKAQSLQSKADESDDDIAREELLAAMLAMEFEADSFEIMAEAHADQASSLEDAMASIEEEIAEAIEELEAELAELETEALEAELEAEEAAAEAETEAAEAEAEAAEEEAEVLEDEADVDVEEVEVDGDSTERQLS